MESLLIGAAALGCVSGLLAFLSRRAAGRAVLMSTTDTKSLGNVETLVQEIRADLPGDDSSGYAEYCELKGQFVCDEPVVGELSGESVAIVETKVLRVIETRRERKEEDGRVTVTWHKSNETLSENRREATFWLDDGSGRVRVLPKGAEMEMDKIVERFEPPSAVERSSGSQMALSVGSFSLSVAGARHGNQRRTLGYRFEERVMHLGRDIYALGEVADTNDGIVLRKPETTDGPYVLSLKSEAELIQSKESSARWLKIGAIVALASALALAVMGLLK